MYLLEVVMGMEVANEILRQLGGNRFILMTGAKNFAGTDNSLTFKIGRNKSKANYVRITLTSMDDYTMEFLNVSLRNKPMQKVLKEHNGLLFDQLQELFTEFTGMYTKL
jgi:hypothetical protein